MQEIGFGTNWPHGKCLFRETAMRKAFLMMLAVVSSSMLVLLSGCSKNLPASEKLKQAENIQNPIKIASGPFGFSKGMSKDEIQKIIHLDLKQVSFDDYVTTVVPIPHNSMESYHMRIDPNLGLCSMEAHGKTIQTNPQGESLRFAFNKMKKALAEKYGPVSDEVDLVKEGSFFKSPGSWMIALNKKERELMAIWQNKADHQLGNDLSAVALIAAADTMYSGNFGLVYEFLNIDECNKNHEKAMSNGL